jgi:hypothetical protein
MGSEVRFQPYPGSHLSFYFFTSSSVAHKLLLTHLDIQPRLLEGQPSQETYLCNEWIWQNQTGENMVYVVLVD